MGVVVDQYHLAVNDPWVHWGYFFAATVGSLTLGLGAYRIHGETEPRESDARRWWQKFFNTVGAAAGWLAGWVVLVRWLGCAGFVCDGEPSGWTMLLAVIAFAGISGQLPFSLMVSIDALRVLIGKLDLRK